METKRFKFNFNLGNALPTVLAVVTALVIGAFIIMIVGESPFRAYAAMLKGAFNGVDAIAATLGRQLPLLMTGLGYAVAFQAGLVNFGCEGQLQIGALAAAIAGYMIDLPWFLHIPVVILCGAVAGGLYAAIAGFLKAQYRVNEFLTTLMMNYVATFFCQWAINGPFKDSTPEAKGMMAATQRIADSAVLPTLIPTTRLTWGYIIAIGLMLALWWFLYKTRRGYEFRMHGLNPLFAEYGGIDSKKLIIQSMFLAGAMAGMGGAFEIMGTHQRFLDGFSAGYGFDGISSAILGLGTPIGTYIASFFFSALKTGAMGMDRMTRVPFELRNVVQATVIFLIASNVFQGSVKWFSRKSKNPENPKKPAKKGVA